VSLPDATARHLATDIDWRHPPAIVRAALDAADPAFPLDGLAGWRDHLDPATRPDPRRRARIIAAQAHLSTHGAATWPALQAVQAILLGAPAPFRAAEAFAHHPVQTRRYGWRADLESTLDARLSAFAADSVHPLVRACRLYLEIILVHPFTDGNGRAARLWLDHTCRLAGWSTPDLAALSALPKEPGRPLRYWGFVAHAARLLRPRPPCHE
jgi:hypothetical protein